MGNEGWFGSFVRTFVEWKLSAQNAVFGPKEIRRPVLLVDLTFTQLHKSGQNPIPTFRHPDLPNLTFPCFTSIQTILGTPVQANVPSTRFKLR